MASKVKLDPERLQGLVAQAKQIQQDCDIQLGEINKARAGLDWDVPEKAHVDEMLADLQRRTNNQKAKLDSIISATNLAIQEAGNSDDSLKSRIANMIQKILSIIASSPIGTIIAASVTASAIAGVLNSLFGLNSLWHNTDVSAIRKWLDKIPQDPHLQANGSIIDRIRQSQSESANGAGASPSTESIPSTGTSSTNLTQFTSSDVAWNGYNPWGTHIKEPVDYSQYSVLRNFNKDYIYDQDNYSKFMANGQNVGCSATSEAMAVSIARNSKEYTPDKMGWDLSRDGALWNHSNTLLAGKSYTKEQAYQKIYEQIQNGSPVVVPLTGGGPHYVTAIGLKNGVSMSNVTANDILVIDPKDAKVKTLDEIYNGALKMEVNTAASIKVPK